MEAVRKPNRDSIDRILDDSIPIRYSMIDDSIDRTFDTFRSIEYSMILSRFDI